MYVYIFYIFTYVYIYIYNMFIFVNIYIYMFINFYIHAYIRMDALIAKLWFLIKVWCWLKRRHAAGSSKAWGCSLLQLLGAVARVIPSSALAVGADITFWIAGTQGGQMPPHIYRICIHTSIYTFEIGRILGWIPRLMSSQLLGLRICPTAPSPAASAG